MTDRQIYKILIIAAVIVGVTIRIGVYLSAWHFIMDEEALLANVNCEITGPLQYVQAAPPLFLATMNAAHHFGSDELTMRFIPTLAGCAALIAFAALTWYSLPLRGAALATTLFALSPKLIFFSAQLKPYSTDVLVAVALISAVVLPATALMYQLPWLIWLSYPAAFFIPLTLTRKTTLLILPTAMSLWILYLTQIRNVRSNALITWWQEFYFPWHHLQLLPIWIIRSAFSVIDYPLRGLGVLSAIAIAIGTRQLWQQNRKLLLNLLIPLATAFTAALLCKYPFGGSRAMLFAAPTIFFLIGTALWRKNGTTLNPATG